MKSIILLSISLLIGCISFAQEHVNAKVRVHFENKKDSLQGVWIGDCNFDYGDGSSSINKDKSVYKGFSRICTLPMEVSFHIEKGDNFIVKLPDLKSSDKVQYLGKVGVIKNNYVRDRQEFLLNLESQPNFLESSKGVFRAKITGKRDSLLSVAKTLKLSETFMYDEELFWQFYLENYLLFYESLKAGDSNISKANPGLFKPADYYSREDLRSFPDYLRMSFAFYYYHLNNSNTYDNLIKLYRNAGNTRLRPIILAIAKKLVIMRHHNMESLAKLIRRKQHHRVNFDRIYDHVKQVTQKDTLQLTPLTDASGRVVELQKAKKLRTYYYIYSGQHVKENDENFLKWNAFYLKNKDQEARFITIGSNLNNSSKELQSYFIENNIAGIHLFVDQNQTDQFIKNSGLTFFPTIIEVDQNNKFKNWNLPANLEQKNIYAHYFRKIPWIVEPGMRH
jgi:hypothetical protein